MKQSPTQKTIQSTVSKRDYQSPPRERNKSPKRDPKYEENKEPFDPKINDLVKTLVFGNTF